MRRKLEANEMWEIYAPTQAEIAERIKASQAAREELLKEAQEWVLSHIQSLQFFTEDEDGVEPTNFNYFATCLEVAGENDLRHFLHTKSIIDYDGGYVVCKIK